MNAEESRTMNELAGRVEGLGRMVLHLVAKLEDAGLLDGPDFTQGLRSAFVLKPDASQLMQAAKRTLHLGADALDEARGWRRFREQSVQPGKRKQG